MNRGNRLKLFRKYITKHAIITTEYTRPPDPFYRKGSYYLEAFQKDTGANICCGDKNKYLVYKSVYYILKNFIMAETE